MTMAEEAFQPLLCVSYLSTLGLRKLPFNLCSSLSKAREAREAREAIEAIEAREAREK